MADGGNSKSSSRSKESAPPKNISASEPSQPGAPSLATSAPLRSHNGVPHPRFLEVRSSLESHSHQFSRRTLLQNAGFTLAAAAIPFTAESAEAKSSDKSQAANAAATPATSPMPDLSAYMAAAADHPLPADVTECTKQHILDTLAAMVSGSELPPGKAALKFARSYGGEKVSCVVASNILCGTIEAALTNAMLAHSDETDDSHAASFSHPGCSVVPATLAAGEKFAIDGTRFLRAVALGYDIGPRFTMALGGVQFQRDGHRSTHSVAGAFGSAAAASCAAGLTAQQMRWVLDYTAQQSSGIAAWQRDTDHIEKGFAFAGMPARSGITSALLVQSGWTGVDDILTGSDNFFLANSPHSDPAKLLDKLGQQYEVTKTMIKKWTVGSPIQAPLDAMENLLKRHAFSAAQVQQVVVRMATSEAGIVNNRELPDICLQYMIAVMLLDKTATFRSAHDKARMQDPAVLRERAKVQLVPDEELQKLFPQRVAIVEVTLTDGTKLTERIEAVRGTVENPMSHEEVVAKARDLMDPVLGAANCTKLIDTIFTLEKVQDIHQLRPLLQRA